MFDKVVVVFFLLVCLGIHVLINLHNILLIQRSRDDMRLRSKVEMPSGIPMILVGLGTLVYFLEALMYSLAVLINPFSSCVFLFPLRYPFMFFVQALGLVFTSAGFFIFNWSVIVRGRYAVSWNMPKDHKLITTGPYRYIRHPSYLGFFLMFIGLPLLLSNPFSLIPLIAIPGYYRATAHEERLLTERFGNEYQEYQKKTGRFFPKLHRTR